MEVSWDGARRKGLQLGKGRGEGVRGVVQTVPGQKKGGKGNRLLGEMQGVGVQGHQHSARESGGRGSHGPPGHVRPTAATALSLAACHRNAACKRALRRRGWGRAPKR